MAGAAVVLVALWSGCAGAPKPARVDGSIVAAAALNPSVSGRPSPLLLRVYELRSAASFNQADFMALYQTDQAALGPDLVAREEIMLRPGETRLFARALAPDTRFIGVVAAYRDLERSVWRAIVPVQGGKAHQLRVLADSLSISAAVQP